MKNPTTASSGVSIDNKLGFSFRKCYRKCYNRLIKEDIKTFHVKIGIIVGSHRGESQSTKVAKYIASKLKDTFTYDLQGNPLPLWDQSKWDAKSALSKQWKPISTNLKECDAFVVISPEWGGMVPAGLKNFFLFCRDELAHKPALIVSVSSGRGGSYPVAELRMSSYKNSHICYIPEHVIVSHVEDVLNNGELDENDKADSYIKKRLAYALDVLEKYALAFMNIQVNLEEYPYGM